MTTVAPPAAETKIGTAARLRTEVAFCLELARDALANVGSMESHDNPDPEVCGHCLAQAALTSLLPRLEELQDSVAVLGAELSSTTG